MTGMTSNFDLLDAELKTDDNVNYQLIVNLLDYESLDSGGDSVLVAITEVSTPNTRQPLQVIIKNLDDEHPTLTVSNCILEVSICRSVEISTELQLLGRNCHRREQFTVQFYNQ
jgi:hypothetical protein